MFLSIRGDTEFRVMQVAFKLSGDKNNPAALVWDPIELPENPSPDKAATVQFFVKKLITGPAGWKKSNEAEPTIKPAPYPYKEGDMDQLAQSVQRGQQLFVGSEKHPRGPRPTASNVTTISAGKHASSSTNGATSPALTTSPKASSAADAGRSISISAFIPASTVRA